MCFLKDKPAIIFIFLAFDLAREPFLEAAYPNLNHHEMKTNTEKVILWGVLYTGVC